MGDIGVTYTDKIGASLRAAQVVGLTSTAFLCGKTFSNSISTTPALLLAPEPLLARQWKKMFDSDKALAPVVVLFSSGVFSYLAYSQPFTSKLYTASASLLALTIPYSYFFFEPINKKLEALVNKFEASANHGPREDETAHYLVDRWASVNLGRTALTGVAAVLALWAAVGKLQVGNFGIVSGAERVGRF